MTISNFAQTLGTFALNNYLIDQSELTTLIIEGEWNCTLTKKNKKGGLPWRPTGFRNLILISMDIFDLVDIQRVKHPNINKYSYESKALKMRSRIDFFLIAKNLTKYVQKVDIQSSIAPDTRLFTYRCSGLKKPQGALAFGSLTTLY